LETVEDTEDGDGIAAVTTVVDDGVADVATVAGTVPPAAGVDDLNEMFDFGGCGLGLGGFAAAFFALFRAARSRAASYDGSSYTGLPSAGFGCEADPGVDAEADAVVDGSPTPVGLTFFSRLLYGMSEGIGASGPNS
jgi:hypothetical protein